MLSIDLETVDLMPGFEGMRVAFPISSAYGTADLATVFMEIEPGHELPIHTDSAEELLLVIDGEVEATVGDERATLGARQAAVVPALAPHGLRNHGTETARILGFFASSTNIGVFDEQVFVVGAPMPIVVPREEPAAVAA